jgi:hypothetical protein
MWSAFPASDYYGDSVAMRVAPVRQSHDPCAVDVQDDLGAPFVPLVSLEARRRSPVRVATEPSKELCRKV